LIPLEIRQLFLLLALLLPASVLLGPLVLKYRTCRRLGLTEGFFFLLKLRLQGKPVIRSLKAFERLQKHRLSFLSFKELLDHDMTGGSSPALVDGLWFAKKNEVSLSVSKARELQIAGHGLLELVQKSKMERDLDLGDFFISLPDSRQLKLNAKVRVETRLESWSADFREEKFIGDLHDSITQCLKVITDRQLYSLEERPDELLDFAKIPDQLHQSPFRAISMAVNKI